IGRTQTLQMSTKKPIAKVVNQVDSVARVQPVLNEPSKVVVTGLEAGITKLEFTDVDGKTEVLDVIVQQDIEYLRNVLRRTVPTANVEPIPGSQNSLIIRGTVSRAEDVDIILNAARAVAGGNVVNAMRVAGVQQVQLCVTVARVSRDQFRRMAFDFLGNS